MALSLRSAGLDKPVGCFAYALSVFSNRIAISSDAVDRKLFRGLAGLFSAFNLFHHIYEIVKGTTSLSGIKVNASTSSYEDMGATIVLGGGAAVLETESKNGAYALAFSEDFEKKQDVMDAFEALEKE